MHKKYLPRYCSNRIQKYLKIFPVVGILGARQTGKSTLVKHILENYGAKKKVVYLDLENYEQFNLIHKDPLSFFRANEKAVVCLDEIQRLPEIFACMRGIIDEDRRPGRFIITGSASPDLLKQSSESLAGRIGYIDLPPFHSLEIGKPSISLLEKHWLRGGFPESFLANTNDQSFEWRDNFLRNFLERDLPQFAPKISSLRLRDLISLLQSSHGQIINYSQLGSMLKISSNTINEYIDLLEQTYFLRRIIPYSKNIKKRIRKSPKIYFRDSGMLHTVARIKTLTDLKSHPLYGFSFEGYVIDNLINIFNDWTPFYYRTSAGEEIDLILEQGIKKIAIEIKASAKHINLTKPFYTALGNINPIQTFVIVPSYTKSLLIEEKITIGNLSHIIDKIKKLEK